MAVNVGSLFTALTALSLLAASEARATRCGYIGPPCEELAAADAVFIGTVVGTMLDTSARGDDDARVDVVVTRVIKGSVSGHVTLIGTWFNRMLRFEDGSYSVPPGEYVFYAIRRGGELVVGACSRTAPIASADEDLRYFDALATNRNASIVGTVMTLDDGELIATPELEIIVEGEGMRRVLRTIGSEYSVGGLASGDYTVTIVPPEETWLMRRSYRMRICDRDCRRADFVLLTE
jgi:hypothetical protein